MVSADGRLGDVVKGHQMQLKSVRRDGCLGRELAVGVVIRAFRRAILDRSYEKTPGQRRSMGGLWDTARVVRSLCCSRCRVEGKRFCAGERKRKKVGSPGGGFVFDRWQRSREQEVSRVGVGWEVWAESGAA